MAAYYDEAPLDPAAGIFASAGRIGPDSPSYYVFDINMRFDELFMNNTFINLHITNLLNNQVRYPAFVNNTWHGQRFGWRNKKYCSYRRI